MNSLCNSQMQSSSGLNRTLCVISVKYVYNENTMCKKKIRILGIKYHMKNIALDHLNIYLSQLYCIESYLGISVKYTTH